MTIIKYYEEDKIATLQIEGHSGYRESGADIVCAAVSILAHSFCEMLSELDGVSVDLEEMYLLDGSVYVRYRDAFGYTYPMLQMLKIGFDSLENEYPENVRVEWVESDS